MRRYIRSAFQFWIPQDKTEWHVAITVTAAVIVGVLIKY